jgi:hypothetical protein
MYMYGCSRGEGRNSTLLLPRSADRENSLLDQVSVQGDATGACIGQMCVSTRTILPLSTYVAKHVKTEERHER